MRLSEKKVKRIYVGLPQIYVDGIDRLIKEGIYMNRSEAVKDALRRLFKHYDLDVLKINFFVSMFV